MVNYIKHCMPGHDKFKNPLASTTKSQEEIRILQEHKTKENSPI